MATLVHAISSGGGFQDWSASLPDVWVERTYVEALRANIVVAFLGRQATLQENNGKVVRWLDVSNPSADATPLAEAGEPANSTDFTLNSSSATLAEFGAFSEFSKFLARTAISGTVEEILQGLGYKGALSIDTYCLGSNVLAGGTPTAVDAGSSLSAQALATVTGKMWNAGGTIASAGGRGKAKPHPRSPGGSLYITVVSPEQAIDMMSEGSPTWSQAKNELIESNLRTPFEDSPVSAAIYGQMVKVSENVQRDAAQSPDDDLGYCIGKDAFGTAFMPGTIQNPVDVRVTMPDERVDLHLRNKGHAAYWFLFGAARIDNNRYVEVRSGATGVGV